MHICVLSDSHAAAVKSGYEQLGDSLGCKITIFAAPNRGLRFFKISDTKDRLSWTDPAIRDMISNTSGGLAEVVVADYDAFLVHGLFVIPPRFDTRHSRAFQSAATQSMLSGSLGLRLATELAGITKAPVLLSPEPLLADLEDDGVTSVQKRSNAPVDPLPFEAVCDAMRAACDIAGIDWLFQPPSTIGPRLNTDRSYSTNPSRLSVGADEKHLEKDVRHMNSDYGSSVLKALVEKVGNLT